jgi:S1-C subfamily serine protease
MNGKSYEAIPVLFNPTLDVAILRINGLRAKPLSFNQRIMPPGTPVALLGYPGENYTVSSGELLEIQDVYVDNIYGTGQFNRQVYKVHAPISSGSSGGPILGFDGQVVGVVFAKTKKDAKHGYALPAASIMQDLDKAQTSINRTGTGICASH